MLITPREEITETLTLEGRWAGIHVGRKVATESGLACSRETTGICRELAGLRVCTMDTTMHITHRPRSPGLPLREADRRGKMDGKGNEEVLLCYPIA